jgi:predicted DNA-binding WGR domain protein
VKLVRQTVLQFREGTSDKVYEIDLCELGPESYVVNFRFGRRGSKLQDGSKTPLPVSRAQADKVWDALVREKTTKGYRAADAAPPAEAAPAVTVRVEDVEDPRHRRIVALMAGTERGWTRDQDHLVWRAGELRVRAAAPLVVALIPGATQRRAWHLARALLRMGEPTTSPALHGLWESSATAPHVRSLAAHAILAVSPDDARDRFRRRLAASVPESALAALAAPGEAALSHLLAECAREPGLFDQLYLAHDFGHLPSLLALAAAIPFADPTFLGVRRVFQAAEARGDGAVWGALALRVETEKPAVARVMRRRSGGVAGAWSSATRRWFRRRVWRTLFRLGQAGLADDYTALAQGLLAAMPESLAPTGGAHWAVGHTLYAEARGASFDARKLRWRATPGTGRDEAFPTLWDQHPERLAQLLSTSRNAAVHTFAARALRANPSAWPTVPLADLVAWLTCPFPGTVALGVELAVGRYDPRHPDVSLVTALLASGHAGARDTSMGWVRADPAPFLRDAEFVVAVVLHAVAEVRRFALELLSTTTLPPDRARVVVEAVLDAALRTRGDDASATDRLRDAAAVLSTAFAIEVRQVPLELVRALLGHASAGAAELGARLLLTHAVRPPDLPDDLLAAAMTSPHAAVRGIGIRLYGELSDATLAERFRVLLALVASPLSDVRAAGCPIAARLARSNASFGRTFLRALLPTLVREAPAAGVTGDLHRDLVSFLRADLASFGPAFDAAAVFQLLRARETVVQELGGDLLRTNVDPATLQVAELVVLARSDVLAVRRSGWALLDQRVEQVRADPDSLLPVLDAPWEDTRRFAFGFVRDRVGAQHLGPATTIAVCDSVRDDVQAFGRALLSTRFEAEDGPRYLAMLAQHPDPSMQVWASAWLEAHAAGHVDRLQALVPFLAAVLLRPNRAKVAKARVLAFLGREALRDEASARVVAGVLTPLSMSAARTYRDAAVAVLAAIRAQFPAVETGLRLVEPEVRGAV